MVNDQRAKAFAACVIYHGWSVNKGAEPGARSWMELRMVAAAPSQNTSKLVSVQIVLLLECFLVGRVSLRAFSVSKIFVDAAQRTVGYNTRCIVCGSKFKL